jgi:hypothetical protein
LALDPYQLNYDSPRTAEHDDTQIAAIQCDAKFFRRMSSAQGNKTLTIFY